MKELFDELGTCKIQNHSVFGFLCGENVDILSPYFESRTFKAGEMIWKEGDSCDYVGIISSGQVEAKKTTEFEGRHVMVGIYSKGAAIGSLCLLDNSRRPVTMVCREETVLVTITMKKLDQLLADHPDMGIKLLKGMLLSTSIRLRSAYERMAQFF